MTKDLAVAHNINRYQYIILFVCVGVIHVAMYSGKYDVSDVTMSMPTAALISDFVVSCTNFVAHITQALYYYATVNHKAWLSV
jgi:hypothetical protein